MRNSLIIVAVAMIAAVLPGAAHASQLRSSDAARGLASPTRTPTTPRPTKMPTPLPTRKPTQPTKAPTPKPSAKPTTSRPTKPTTSQPTARPTTARPTTPTLRPTDQRVEPEFLTEAPSTAAPVTAAPTTATPTTDAPTMAAPTTAAPTTAAPTTAAPTTDAPTTAAPTTAVPTTAAPTTAAPTTDAPTTAAPTTAAPTTRSPTTASPTTANPTTASPTTQAPTKNPTIKTDTSSFHFDGATLTSCTVNARYIRSTTTYSGVTCGGDSLTVWANHDLSTGVASSFKSGLSNSNQMVMDGSASSPGELFFFVDVTVTMVVRGVTMTATLRVGQRVAYAWGPLGAKKSFSCAAAR